jgi:hypothetical protein
MSWGRKFDLVDYALAALIHPTFKGHHHQWIGPQAVIHQIKIAKQKFKD